MKIDFLQKKKIQMLKISFIRINENIDIMNIFNISTQLEALFSALLTKLPKFINFVKLKES